MDAVQRPGGNPPQKLAIDKFSDRGVAVFKLSGWIDEDFDGKRLAQTIHARTLVLHLGEIRRISSFGIREWVDFIAAAAKVTDRIILVECAPKVIDQVNMVGNFIGPGQIFSFYAPYRCDYCDTESQSLLRVDRDWDLIKSMKPPERPCPNCGDVEYFDEDPVTFLSYIAAQGQFSLDPDIAALLSSKLSHAVSDAAQRLHVDKAIEDRFTYLKLSGDLDGSFPRIKLAEGLEGTVVIDLTSLGRVEPAGAAEWRGFMQIITPAAEAIVMLGVPPAFLEKLTNRDDLGPRAQVLTIALPYTCSACATTAPHVIDVVQHYDVLKFATPPEMKCEDCKSPAYCTATEGLLSHLPSLPKPGVTPQIRKFIKAMKDRKPPERKPVAAPQVTDAHVQVRQGNWLMVIAAALFAALLTGGVLIAYIVGSGSDDGPGVGQGAGKLLEASAPDIPDWITSETAFSSYCNTDAQLGLSCIGVSSLADNEADARDEAQDAALEAVVHAMGLRIDHPDWTRTVSPIFSDARQATLGAFFDRAQRDPGSLHYDRAQRAVRDGRSAVARALRETAGKLIPAAPTALYWRRYEGPGGAGFRYSVFVQYKLTGDTLADLVGRYSSPVEALGTEAMTAFPGIAWRYPEIERGAVLTKLGDGSLKAIGLAERYIVLSIQDRVVKDAASFGRILGEEMKQLREDGGTLRLTVKTGDNTPMEFNRPIEKSSGASNGNGNGNGRPSGGTRPNGSTGRLPPVNTWDRVGQGNRDDPTQ